MAVVIAGAKYWASSQAAAVRSPVQGPVVRLQARNNTSRPRLQIWIWRIPDFK